MKRFDFGRLLALLCLVLPLASWADTVKIGDSESGRPLDMPNQAVPISLVEHMPGDRNEGSTTGTDFTGVAGEWKSITQASNATGDVVIYSGPAVVRMVRVRFANDAGTATSNTAGIILVKDGSVVKEGAAAAKTPGATIFDGLDGTVFRTNVTINFANAADNPASNGKIEILMRPSCSGDNCPTW